MLTGCKWRDVIIGGATCIAAKFILKVIIQHVGFIHIAVDDEFKIMADTTSRNVNSVLIGQSGHEIRRAVHASSVLK